MNMIQSFIREKKWFKKDISHVIISKSKHTKNLTHVIFDAI